MIDAQTKSVGAAAVGGPFSLIDQDGKPFSSDQLKKEFSILYFGFTQCPDICPDELDKISEAIGLIRKTTLLVLLVLSIGLQKNRQGFGFSLFLLPLIPKEIIPNLSRGHPHAFLRFCSLTVECS